MYRVNFLTVKNPIMPMCQLKKQFHLFCFAILLVSGKVGLLFADETSLEMSSMTSAKPVAEVSALISPSSANENPHQIFLTAELAIENKQWSRLESLLDSLQDHPLLAYLEQKKLLQQFNPTSIPQVKAFIDRYGDQPVTRALRSQLLNWAASQNDAETFLRYYQSSSSASLNCYQLRFSLAAAQKPEPTQVDQTKPAQTKFNKTKQSLLESIWLSPESLPKACDPLISQWKKAGQLSLDLIWQRLKLAVSHKSYRLAHYLVRQLPVREQEAGKLLVQAAKNPYSLRKAKFKQPLTKQARDIVEIGLNKIAWSDPERAIQLWHKLSPASFEAKDSALLTRSIALSLAVSGSEHSAEWLNLLEIQSDQAAQQWLLADWLKTRNWSKIEALTESILSHNPSSQWQYWNAVAAENTGQIEKATNQFQTLANQRHFYGFLAALKLGQSPDLAYQPYTVNAEQLEFYESQSGAQRAKALFEMSRFQEARSEWNYWSSQFNHQEKSALAHLAFNWGWHHQAIVTFATSSHRDDIEKRFPLGHFSTYQQSSQQHQLPLSWPYAITRQESAFQEDAISPAGAKGLMQLTHPTAALTAPKSKLAAPYQSSQQLLDAQTNIQLGTAHLADIFTAFQDNPVLATAAYNAGKHKVEQWVKNRPFENAIEWIEQIPYRETRDYVKNVMTYELIYAELLNQPSVFVPGLNRPKVSSEQRVDNTPGQSREIIPGHAHSGQIEAANR